MSSIKATRQSTTFCSINNFSSSFTPSSKVEESKDSRRHIPFKVRPNLDLKSAAQDCKHRASSSEAVEETSDRKLEEINGSSYCSSCDVNTSLPSRANIKKSIRLSLCINLFAVVNGSQFNKFSIKVNILGKRVVSVP